MNDDRLEYVKCDLCGSGEYNNIINTKDYYNTIEGVFSIVKCKSCGLIYTNPRPKISRIEEFYPDDAGYYQPAVPDINSKKHKQLKELLINYYNYPGKKSVLKKLLLFPRFLLNVRTIGIKGIPYYKGGKLLDIGCSYGGYLYQMRDLGYDVMGIELNKKASDYANNKLNIKVINTLIDDYEVVEKFDVVYLGMVLEHVLSPTKTLNKIHSILKDDGQLIFSIPDFNGFERRLYGKYCYTLHMPAHITHYDTKSIKKYLDKEGFELVKIVHQKSPKDFIHSLKNMGEKRTIYLKLFEILDTKIIRKTIIQMFINIMSFLGLTSRMTVYAKKKSS